MVTGLQAGSLLPLAVQTIPLSPLGSTPQKLPTVHQQETGVVKYKPSRFFRTRQSHHSSAVGRHARFVNKLKGTLINEARIGYDKLRGQVQAHTFRHDKIQFQATTDTITTNLLFDGPIGLVSQEQVCEITTDLLVSATTLAENCPSQSQLWEAHVLKVQEILTAYPINDFLENREHSFFDFLRNLLLDIPKFDEQTAGKAFSFMLSLFKQAPKVYQSFILDILQHHNLFKGVLQNSANTFFSECTKLIDWKSFFENKVNNSSHLSNAEAEFYAVKTFIDEAATIIPMMSDILVVHMVQLLFSDTDPRRIRYYEDRIKEILPNLSNGAQANCLEKIVKDCQEAPARLIYVLDIIGATLPSMPPVERFNFVLHLWSEPIQLIDDKKAHKLIADSFSSSNDWEEGLYLFVATLFQLDNNLKQRLKKVAFLQSLYETSEEFNQVSRALFTEKFKNGSTAWIETGEQNHFDVIKAELMVRFFLAFAENTFSRLSEMTSEEFDDARHRIFNLSCKLVTKCNPDILKHLIKSKRSLLLHEEGLGGKTLLFAFLTEDYLPTLYGDWLFTHDPNTFLKEAGLENGLGVFDSVNKETATILWVKDHYLAESRGIKYRDLKDVFTKRIALGDDSAYNDLGYIYFTGKDVEKSYQKAYSNYSLAVKKDVANATTLFHLGDIYYDGLGQRKNHKDAFKYYKLAAEKGHVGAMSSLGFCYQHGHGTAWNSEKAKFWYSKAAEQGNEEAKNRLKKFK
jgi:hypothetical protein